MGRRFWDDRTPEYANFTSTWGRNPGRGKWMKHRLSKARRKWKDKHRRGLLHVESECNWRGW